MNMEYVRHYSTHLGRDMELKRYGHGGKPVIFIPCQGGRFYDFENFGMIHPWAKWIEEGRCTVYAIDTVDQEAWAALGGDCRKRMERHEAWICYVVEEVVPLIWDRSGGRRDIVTFGASMGAMHAVNLYYRRPDVFSGGVFAISGLYDNRIFFQDYCDDLVYQNCPCLYLPHLPWDHPYYDLYRSQTSLVVCGQGAWEEPLLDSTRRLDTVCCEKGIPTRFEYWGYDVNHDWPWWFRMVEAYGEGFVDQA